jgi:hypothetical protein
MGRELLFEVSPDTRMAVGGNKTDTNCKFTKNIMELLIKNTLFCASHPKSKITL